MKCLKCNNVIDLKKDGDINQEFIYCSGCGWRYNRNQEDIKFKSGRLQNNIREILKNKSNHVYKLENYSGNGRLEINFIKFKPNDIEFVYAESTQSLNLIIKVELVGITQNFSENDDGSLYRKPPELRNHGGDDYVKKFGVVTTRTVNFGLLETPDTITEEAFFERVKNLLGTPCTIIEYVTIQQYIKQTTALFSSFGPHPRQIIPSAKGRSKRGESWL